MAGPDGSLSFADGFAWGLCGGVIVAVVIMLVMR